MRYSKFLSTTIIGLSLPFSVQGCAQPVEAPSNDGSAATAEVSPAPQIARFTVWLDKLDQDLLGLTPDEAPDSLVASGARAITFDLQALGRLYASEDPRFEALRRKFKSLEDGIGNYQKWVDLENDGRNNGVSESVLARLAQKREAARVVLVDALDTTGFVPKNPARVPYTQELRTFLDGFAWEDAATDRNRILHALVDELEIIKTTRYDFSHLEEGNGVHEFRRKMRWIAMEARGLDGVITLKPRSTTCPVPAYSRLVFDSIANSKYAVLPGSAAEPKPVALTPCLYVMIARLVEDVNQIKAKNELDNNLAEGETADTVDPVGQAKVEAMLADALSNDLFGLLEEEFSTGNVEAPAE